MIRKLYTLPLSILLMLLLLVAGASPALADEYVCTGAVGAVTLDNVLVPDGTSCSLTGTRMEGNIVIKTGARLQANNVRVDGNIQAEGAAVVRVLAGSTVGGSIQIKQGSTAQVDAVRVNGDIQYESNNNALSATRNEVGGNVQVFQNTGGVTILGNTIDGNLQCKENVPAPTGGNNLVQGNKEDQCANLPPPEAVSPDTSILTGPPAVTPVTSATFTFSGSDNATPELLLLFECALDGAAFQGCTSPYAVQGLAPGQRQLQVRALDMALNADPTPTTYTWMIGDFPWRLYLPILIRN